MFLRYYLDDKGNRVYTLKKEDPTGKQTLSAHPARFSPEDKNSQYRIIIKKRKIVLSFVLFFIGWKALGLVVVDKILWRYDEKLGKMRMFEVKEVKRMQQAAIEEEKKKKITSPLFPLDD
uniref:Nucleolar protein 10 n=1 Tax=Syphacia muris TaxID=451379 RepID=A0A0N5ARP4_9BILA